MDLFLKTQYNGDPFILYADLNWNNDYKLTKFYGHVSKYVMRNAHKISDNYIDILSNMPFESVIDDNGNICDKYQTIESLGICNNESVKYYISSKGNKIYSFGEVLKLNEDDFNDFENYNISDSILIEKGKVYGIMNLHNPYYGLSDYLQKNKNNRKSYEFYYGDKWAEKDTFRFVRVKDIIVHKNFEINSAEDILGGNSSNTSYNFTFDKNDNINIYVGKNILKAINNFFNPIYFTFIVEDIKTGKTDEIINYSSVNEKLTRQWNSSSESAVEHAEKVYEKYKDLVNIDLYGFYPVNNEYYENLITNKYYSFKELGYEYVGQRVPAYDDYFHNFDNYITSLQLKDVSKEKNWTHDLVLYIDKLHSQSNNGWYEYINIPEELYGDLLEKENAEFTTSLNDFVNYYIALQRKYPFVFTKDMISNMMKKFSKKYRVEETDYTFPAISDDTTVNGITFKTVTGLCPPKVGDNETKITDKFAITSLYYNSLSRIIPSGYRLATYDEIKTIFNNYKPNGLETLKNIGDYKLYNVNKQGYNYWNRAFRFKIGDIDLYTWGETRFNELNFYFDSKKNRINSLFAYKPYIDVIHIGSEELGNNKKIEFIVNNKDMQDYRIYSPIIIAVKDDTIDKSADEVINQYEKNHPITTYDDFNGSDITSIKMNYVRSCGWHDNSDDSFTMNLANNGYEDFVKAVEKYIGSSVNNKKVVVTVDGQEYKLRKNCCDSKIAFYFMALMNIQRVHEHIKYFDLYYKFDLDSILKKLWDKYGDNLTDFDRINSIKNFVIYYKDGSTNKFKFTGLQDTQICIQCLKMFHNLRTI